MKTLSWARAFGGGVGVALALVLLAPSGVWSQESEAVETSPAESATVSETATVSESPATPEAGMRHIDLGQTHLASLAARLEPRADDRRLLVTVAQTTPKTLEATVAALAEEYRLRKLTAWDLRSLGVRCVVFEVRRRHDPEAMVARLMEDPRVELAQRVARFRPQGSANPHLEDDPYQELQHALIAIGLGRAHQFAMGAGVRVAIVDTAVEVDHPDLGGRVVLERSFVPPGVAVGRIHGTAVAGVIAAGANGVGILGIAPKADLLVLEACWSEGSATDRTAVCDSLSLARALDAALVHDADIVNLSLGGPADPLLTQLIRVAVERGLVVVASDDGQGSFPASLDEVLAVAAGAGEAPPSADLRAPGTDILSTAPGGRYDFFSGASLAAAQVSGVCALLREVDASLDTPAVRRLLRPTPASTAALDTCTTVARLARPTSVASGSSSSDPCSEARLAVAP